LLPKLQHNMRDSLPICRDNEHRVGSWVRGADSAKSFTSCSSGPFEPNTEFPLLRPSWLYKQETLHGCRCDLRQRRTILDTMAAERRSASAFSAPRRDAEQFVWRPTHCRLAEWNAQRFCHALRARRLAFVGDSTIRQVAWTVWSLVRAANATCADQLWYESSDTLVNGCLGYYGRGGSVEQIVQRLVEAGRRPDIVVLSAGAHVYRTRCDYPAFKGSGCAQGPMRCTHPQADHFKKIVFSQGAVNSHLVADPAIQRTTFNFVVDDMLRQTQRLLAAAAKDGLRPVRFIWKSVSPGHPDCFSHLEHGPQPFGGYATDAPYNWASFPAFDEAARAASAMSNGTIEYMDVSMLYDRVDGHGGYSNYSEIQNPSAEIGKADCLHFCTPGPLDEVARVLQQHLLGVEAGHAGVGE